VNDDVLKVDPAAVLEELKEKLPPSIASPLSYKVVANLPYYITSPVLRHFLEGVGQRPDTLVVMVQKEVAEAITAKPGEMSILAVSIQFYGQPRVIEYVSAGNFYPPPKVDSAILKIEMYTEPPVKVNSQAGFFKVVRAGFCAARKQIANSLAQGLDIPKAEALSLLEEARLDLKGGLRNYPWKS
jgi:16S rRNA (adenine1518-N6/adenine1519-N6)-dimethyltransferase